MKLTIYSRPGCHLCEEAIELAEGFKTRFGYEIEIVDIEQDDQLHRLYLEAIPVIVLDGRELLRIDGYRRGGLERSLQAACSGPGGGVAASY